MVNLMHLELWFPVLIVVALSSAVSDAELRVLLQRDSKPGDVKHALSIFSISIKYTL